MPDIIGTPVERVIPEGWSVLRSAEVAAGDAMESGGKWAELVYQERREKTDANGRLWGTHLVIRRNAPEPSVEKLRRERDEWKALTELQEVTVANLKAKVAELEAVPDEKSKRYLEWQVQQFRESCGAYREDVAIHGAKLKVAQERGKMLEAEIAHLSAAKDAEIEALRKERDEWKAHFTASEAQVGKLQAKVAELERLRVVECERADNYWNLLEASRDKVAELEKEKVALEKEARRLEKAFDDVNGWYMSAAAKLNAVKKAWEGA